jgi:UDP-N-acetyl-D-glucosamine dehydrogenase
MVTSIDSLDLVIVGLGYVGLPLAQQASRRGLKVAGFDIHDGLVAALNDGASHIDDLSDDAVATMLEQGFFATTDPTVFSRADSIVICVPTPLAEDTTPDLGAVTAATTAISQHLTADTLVVLESTTYPGTTDDIVRPILEENSGLAAGQDFFLAYSPERIDPGNPIYGVQNTPKVVGGHTKACTTRAVDFYARFVDTVVPVAGTREAEMSKLIENTYRHVNIAMVNEMAVFSHDLGIDLWASIDAAATKPFGFQAFYPGPGVGGHCIPIDPNYLSYAVRTLGYPFRFVELAQEVSGRMPAYVAARAQGLLNESRKAVNGSKILVLGVSYKANIADDRETPSRPLIRRLRDLGADVAYVDPNVKSFSVDDVTVPRHTDLSAAVVEADLVLLVQAHDQFLVHGALDGAALILDTRGVLEGPSVTRL